MTDEQVTRLIDALTAPSGHNLDEVCTQLEDLKELIARTNNLLTALLNK